MSDKSFQDKMEMSGGFKESALRLNSFVVKQLDWNEALIKERANLLANKAIEIWEFPQLDEHEIEPYKEVNSVVKKYDINHYDTNDFTEILYKVLDKRIFNLGIGIKRDFKKLYVAYKLDTNFADIMFQKKRLRLSINMKFSEIHDPHGICRDVTNLGRWGNGDVEVLFESLDEIDNVMRLIDQSYNFQVEM